MAAVHAGRLIVIIKNISLVTKVSSTIEGYTKVIVL
jgi:hypothetical protein